MKRIFRYFSEFGTRKNNLRLSPESSILARYDFAVNYGEVYQRELQGEEYETLIREDANALRRDLSSYFEKYVRDLLGDEVTVQIDRIEIGSITGAITLILVSTLSVYTYVSQYHDFMESLNLIRNQLRSRITHVLGQRHSMFDIDVRVILTRGPSIAQQQQNTTLNEPTPIYSKAFFWYLFFSNILLLTALGLLLYKAVASVYFAP